MNCFSCFRSQRSCKSPEQADNVRHLNEFPVPETMNQKGVHENHGESGNQPEGGEMATFTFRELATATKNFRQECLLGEGGFGRVYRGTLASSGQVVAVKQLDRNGMQAGNKDLLAEVMSLSLLHHPNLVNLIGYCADGDQRLLVYEYMSRGSLDALLLNLGSEQKPLDWHARMKIAFGTAKGLEYLHERANPPLTYRDLKPSNILLDEDYTPKLSDVGIAKLGRSGDNMNFTSRAMGTYGYSAPEYSRGGQPTFKSDVYSFGVILLELITGRRAIDTSKPNDEQNLVSWAQPLFRDPKRYPDMADPLLGKQFPEKDLNQAVAIAAMCLQEESTARPLMSDIVMTLSFLSVPTAMPVLSPSSDERGFDSDHQQPDDTWDGEETDHESEEEAESSASDHDKYDDNNDKQSGGESSGDDDVSNISRKLIDGSIYSSSRKGSRKSLDLSISSSHRKSRRSQDGSDSMSRMNSNGSQYNDDEDYETEYSSDQSSAGSRVSSVKASLSQKSSRKSINHSSRKSRDRISTLSSRKSSNKSHKSFKSHKSIASSLSRNSSSMDSNEGNEFLAYRISGSLLGTNELQPMEDDRSSK